MLSGVFYLTFQSSMGILGAGLAVLENGQIRGGDDSYLYSGSYYVVTDSSSFTAQVNVEHYQGDRISIFGVLNSFQLELTGCFTENSLRADGNLKGQKAFKILLEGAKIEDVYSSMIPGKTLNLGKGEDTSSSKITDKILNLDKKDEFLLDDPFNLLNEANRRSFSTAVQLHSSSKYLDALKIMFPIIEATINALLQKIGETPEKFSGLTKKAEALGNKNVIPHHIVHANDIVYARNKVLHGNYAPPDHYLYPISLLAFLHLNSLLTECNLNS